MRRTQNAEELDKYYKDKDPWGYYGNKHDEMRLKVLLSAVEGYRFRRVLDVGCGNGFITESFPGDEIVAVDISPSAIDEAKSRSVRDAIDYRVCSLFGLGLEKLGAFDCVLITGVLYTQYIGNSLPLVYRIIDGLLESCGILISVHIDDWYLAKFPYAKTMTQRYRYREFYHLMEIYRK